jgi:hypothetical protein
MATDTVTGVLVGSVTVTATDGGLHDTLTFTVTAGPVNHIVLAPAAATIDPGSQLYTTTAFDSAGNTTDVTGTAHLAMTPDGSCGSTSCTAIKYGAHTVTSTYSGKSSTATLTILNIAPVATDDSTTVLENASSTAIAVLATDTDANGDALTVTVVSNPSHGLATIDAGGGGVHYAPNANYFGSDSFMYTVSDGFGGTGSGTVTITVTHVNQPPTFTKGVDQTLPEESTPVGQTVSGWATGMSPGPLNEAGQTLNFIVTNDNNSRFSVQPAVAATTGTLTYTLAANRNGPVNVTVVLHDNGGTTPGVDTSAPQTFKITVTGVDHPPAAINDFPTVVQGSGPVAINVLANDSDPDGDPLTVASVTQGTKGHVSIAADRKSLTYDPAGSFIGTDQFLYTVSDGRPGGLAFGTVRVSVVKDTFAPVATTAVAWILGGSINTTASIALTWHGTDVGFGVKTYQLQESRNNAAWAFVTLAVGASSTHRVVTVGSYYQYRIRAIDLVGNIGPWTYLHFTPTLYQESAATYSGAWTSLRMVGALGGRVEYATTHGPVAVFTCTCRSMSWIGPKGALGSARVYIDGVLQGIFSEHTATTLAHQGIFAKTWGGASALHEMDISAKGDGKLEIDGFLTLQ